MDPELARTVRFALMLTCIVVLVVVVSGTYVARAPVPVTAVTGIIAAMGAMVVGMYKASTPPKD